MSSKRKAAGAAHASSDGEQGPGPDGSGAGEPRGRTAVKRQRVSRACDQCRAAREKCDGVQPLCFPCVSQNRACTYRANPKKRGVQTGYIRTLELTLAWVFEKIPGGEDALSSLLSHEGGPGQRLLTGSDSRAANRLHQKWRRSRVHRDIDRILSGGELDPAQDDKSPSLDDGSDSDAEVDRSSAPSREPGGSSRALGPDSISGHAYEPTNSEGQCPVKEEIRRDSTVTSSLNPQPRHSAVSGSPVGLKLPSNHWRLMDIYFSYTHCWLPILEKQDMFQASYLYSPGHNLDLSPDNLSSGTHAELWSALALASYQDLASSSRRAPTAQTDGGGSMTPKQIYSMARSMVPPDDGIFQVHHARALILLSLVNLGRREMTSAWLLIGKAVRIVLDISSGDGFSHDRQRQRLRSVFIACFIMDTMVSRQCGKPPHLTADDMVEAMNIPENDLDEWQPWAACEGFGQAGDDARNSRNPAYCLSTFNQLYDIFKVVSRDMARRRARTGHDAGPVVALSQLPQAINMQAPFGTYILSTGADSAPVPSPYLLKIFYLWATGMVHAISSPTARLMISVIEQFQSRFGTCAMPPFLAACLSSWATHAGFEELEAQDKARFAALEGSHASIWDAESASFSPIVHGRGPQYTPLAYKGASESEHRPDTVVQSFGAAADPFLGSASSYANPGPPAGESSSSSQGRHSMPENSAAYVFPSSYGNPRGLLSPAVTVMSRDTTRNAISDMGNTIAPQAAASLQLQYHVPAPQSSSSLGMPPNPTHYDALLDDLASIDYADRVDTDPQFMMNLGFAPGCDLNEVFSLDFARF